jgi:hypothetical protein
VAEAAEIDRSIGVKMSLAESSGSLDLSECNLSYVPLEVFELQGPPRFTLLTSLKTLSSLWVAAISFVGRRCH